jgi:hypothetical protein
MDYLRANLSETFGLPASAVDWLCAMYDVAQFFDDIADGDPTTRQELDKTIWSCFVGLNTNPFYTQHAQSLAPAVALFSLKWQASDTEERAGNANPVAFVWRAGYFDLVLMAVLLCKGHEYATKNAHLVSRLYGEKIEDYMREFPCPQ